MTGPFLLLSLLLAADPPASSGAEGPLLEAHPISFQSLAAKANVHLGEPFAYSVEIRHRKEESYALRPPKSLKPFLADGVQCRREIASGEARTTCRMQLSLFALGQVDVPDLLFDVEAPGGKAQLSVPGPRITGVGIIDPAAPPGALQLRDIAPPTPLLVRTLRPLYLGLAIALAAALFFFLARKMRRLPPRRWEPAPVSPLERFRRRLAALEAERLPERGEGLLHVARLSEAVRDYLGSLAGRPALDLTSGELVEVLQSLGDPRIDLAELNRFLADADLVKFAKRPAAPELCQAGMEFARVLLERTRPPPPEPAR